MRASHAAVLRETDAAVRKELPRSDLSDDSFHESAISLALFFGNGCPEVLNFRVGFSNEHDQSNVLNPAHPGVTNQLRIERK